MEPGSSDEREIRAVRNQAMFRAVNEQMKALNEAFLDVTRSYSIVCECASPSCVETLEIASEDYAEIRRNPRRFPVLPGHVFSEVEKVVEERPGYVVVEKTVAVEVVEATDPRREVTQPNLG